MNWWKMAKTKAVWLQGPLKKTRDGFYYLDVPGTIVSAFQYLIPDDDLKHPKDQWDEFVGAHISVFYKDEVDGVEIKELGEEFEYKITGLQSVIPQGKDYRVYFVEVESPDLEKLRKRYDLSPKINGHEFHISVGIAEK